MNNSKAWIATVVLASLLAIVGLGYAHVGLAGCAWLIRVAMGSIWRIVAANVAAPTLHAGMLLLPLAAVTVFIAGVVRQQD